MPIGSFVRELLHAAIVAASITLTACQTYRPFARPTALSGARWVLIEYKATPEDAKAIEVQPYRYTLFLAKDGTAKAKLDCNNGATKWMASEQSQGNGKIAFDTLVATMAVCTDDMFGEKLAADLPSMKVWSVYDGRLSLKPASGGPVYVWDSVD